LEKVILVEQFHGKYIVIRIQAVNPYGSELEHVHSIVVKVGDGRAQFNMDGCWKTSGRTCRITSNEVLTVDCN
jgi:hypothetical protein